MTGRTRSSSSATRRGRAQDGSDDAPRRVRVVDGVEERRVVMADVIFIGLTVLFFVVAVAYVVGCDRLGGRT